MSNWPAVLSASLSAVLIVVAGVLLGLHDQVPGWFEVMIAALIGHGVGTSTVAAASFPPAKSGASTVTVTEPTSQA